jgi:hypothetical protein
MAVLEHSQSTFAISPIAVVVAAHENSSAVYRITGPELKLTRCGAA